MQTHSGKEITRLLVAWGDGDQSALEELVPLVHSELHRLAHHYLGRERPKRGYVAWLRNFARPDESLVLNQRLFNRGPDIRYYLEKRLLKEAAPLIAGVC